METSQLFIKFSQGISWNAFFYVTYKVLFTTLSFLLFYHLNTDDYAAWANSYGVIFLVLLWIDFGLRKSIPRYAPVFAQNKKAHKTFIKYLIHFQVILLIIVTPLFITIFRRWFAKLAIKQPNSFFYTGSSIFFLEGLVSLLRLIYHAHFWHRRFNLINTKIVLAEMAINMVIIYRHLSSRELLRGIMMTRAAAAATLAMVSIGMLKKLYKDRNYPGDKKINTRKIQAEFVKHSVVMGISNNIKSLSERNFLVPFFTSIFGPVQANLFKIANDGALLFHRIVTKTIGTTDTSLLAHIITLPRHEQVLEEAMSKLKKKIFMLWVPLLIGALLLALAGNHFFRNNTVLDSFVIMVVGYLLESALSPFERLLEIRRNYWALAIAYVPYSIMLTIAFILREGTSISLVGMLAIMHVFRLTASILMFCLARRPQK